MKSTLTFAELALLPLLAVIASAQHPSHLGTESDTAPPKTQYVSPVAVGRPDLALKAPWNWTLEERLTARCDRRAVDARRRALEPEATRSAVAEGDRILPAEEPYLVLPHEAFQALIRRAFNPNEKVREAFREAYEANSATRALGEGVWPELSAVAARYIHALSEEELLVARLNASGDDEPTVAKLREVQGDICSLRADCLEAARVHFGRPRFDKFLYDVVVPSVDVIVDFVPLDSGVRRDQLLQAAGGCR